MGHLVYFDTGFFQKLTKHVSSPEIERWQRGVIEWINCNLIPWRSLCPPLSFLELIGITDIEHPILTPLIIPKKKRPQGQEFGAVISESLAVHYQEAYEFYSRLPQLQRGELIAATNIKQNLSMNRSPHVQVLAGETIWRFINKDNFEGKIWHSLAIDRVQIMLGQLPNNDETVLRHLQFLREFLSSKGVQANVPLFRSLGVIWKNSLEPKIFKKGTLFRLGIVDDFADSEFLYYSVAGLYEPDTELMASVIVLTMEEPYKVVRRLTVTKYLLEFFKERINSIKLNLKYPTLTPGRVVCFDSIKPIVVDDIIVQEVSSILDDLSLDNDIVLRELSVLAPGLEGNE